MVPEPAASKNALRILCLEDSPEDAQLMCELLRSEGLNVRADVVDTREAFAQALADRTYDLILADYRLPGYSGEDALAIAREKVPGTPFIVVSGTIGEETAVELLKQGAADCVLKDRLGRLPFAVRRALEAARERAALAEASAQAELLAGIVERSLSEIYLFDPETLRFAFVNLGAERNLGYNLKELRAMTPLDLKPEFSEESFRELIGPLLRGEGNILLFETVHRRDDGSLYPVEVHLQLADHPNGRLFLAVITDITERQRGQEALALQARITTIFSTVPHDEMFAEVLAVILEVMQSPLGVFGYLDQNGDWVVPTMTREVWESCQVAEKTMRFPPETWGDGTWPCALREKRTITSNEPSTNIPAGHVAIQRHISLPILFQGEAIGLFQVANKQTDYTEEDIRVLTSIADHIAPILHARLRSQWAEKELRQSEFRHRTVADNTYDWEWWMAPDGNYLYVSPSCERISGHTAAEFLADPDLLLAITHPDDVAKLRVHVEAEASVGQVPNEHRFEFRIVTPSGEERVLEHVCLELIAKDGSFLGRRGSNRDITEHKQAEQAVRASEERYRALAESSPDLIYIIDREDRVLYVNGRAAEAVGHSQQELVGARRTELFGDKTAAHMKRSLDRVFETGEPLEADSQLEYPGGERWISTSLVPMKDAQGRVEAVFGTSRDISERKRSEELLSRYALLATETRDIMLFVRARDGAVVEANAAAEAAYGYSREELLRLGIDDLRATLDGSTLDRQMSAAGADGVLFETEHHRKGGGSFPVEVSSRGTTLLGGEKVFLSVIRDISERKRADQALLESALQLKLTLKAAVAALGTTTEMRDPYTAGHQRRVAELAGAIAAELGWEEGRIESLRTAALLHDIGKIVVPAEILSKPGRLTETEMLLIRQHAGAGADTVADIDFEGAVAESIRQHHERLDGSGYPAGLSEMEILPEARVLAVADTVEAMISHRPYRAALPVEEALAEIEGGSGVRYDTDAAAACVRLFREQGFRLSE